MLNVGWGEVLVILLIALLVVGPKKLPELSRSLGKGLREFRRITGEAQQQLRSALPLDEFNSITSSFTAAATAPTSTAAAVTRPVEPLAPVDTGPPASGNRHRGMTTLPGVDLGPPPEALTKPDLGPPPEAPAPPD